MNITAFVWLLLVAGFVLAQVLFNSFRK